MKKNHIHRFKRHTYNTGNQVFFCTLDNCTFKTDCALTLGKTNICNRCGDAFSMDEYSIRLAKPHCHKCSKKRVRDENNHIRYIRPTDVVSEDIAKNTADKLRDRLSELVSSVEEDI